MHNAIITDLNKCVGCMACSVGCKAVNNVPTGHYWQKVLRVGPTPRTGGTGQFPDVEMYFLPMQCQHCSNPMCVDVCPTEASYIASNGTVQIDGDICIGCQLCVSACPYNVRYLDPDLNIVQKCNMCDKLVADGGRPQCVEQCGGLARFFGDLDGDIMDFTGPYDRTLREYMESGNVEAFEDSDVYHLPDEGNGPALMYILRNREWKGVFE
jgi:Fe-S-cluster-containing dehydrogenase component